MVIESNSHDGLPPTDFEYLRESIEFRIMIETFHNFFLIPDKIYYTKYKDNAEILERDYKIWQELNEIDELIGLRK